MLNVELLMICVIKLIARCRMLLSQRSTLLLSTLLHASACSLTRTCRSFRHKTAALLHASHMLLLPSQLHHAPKSHMRSHSITPIKTYPRKCTPFGSSYKTSSPSPKHAWKNSQIAGDSHHHAIEWETKSGYPLGISVHRDLLRSLIISRSDHSLYLTELELRRIS